MVKQCPNLLTMVRRQTGSNILLHNASPVLCRVSCPINVIMDEVRSTLTLAIMNANQGFLLNPGFEAGVQMRTTSGILFLFIN